MYNRRRSLVYAILIGSFPILQSQVKITSSKSTMEHQVHYVQKQEIVLEPIQAKGGEVIQTDQGKAAVFFPASCPLNDKITWSLKGDLPVGLLQIDFEFYQPEGSFSPNQVVLFEGVDGMKLAKLDLYYIGFTKGTYTKSIGFYSPNPLSVLSLVKSVQRNLNTVAVQSIKIYPAKNDVLEYFMFVFQVPVLGKQLSLPTLLPSGVYVANTSQPVALNWVLPNGMTFMFILINRHNLS
jgi:hypothetical protein